MGLEQTVDQLKNYLGTISKDLEKAMRGNKAASQRVRTMTIRLEKAAKLYRKESIKWEKSGAMAASKASSKKKSSTVAKKKPAMKKKVVAKATSRKSSSKRKPARRR